ncbi:DUF6155 family protein [Galbibacter sp. EGI 63066]|uniref:DUF6155 family protein n=1 Tax=Galbibacter sp. EGI 63066 TaxID=2993559 RepID=UPI0022489FD4|nr:DUF6155 family protein [Galbibacter sp. EGI 63066]MCX2678881.1 DUF6155 family protein [Galbibacter sp. EGI 63066]
MSKRDLKKYLKSLKKKELEEQVLELYGRFKEVKVYYDFVFNPKEDKLIDECKAKIANEYFPVKRRKPRARRSVAQKYIKHFITLGVNPVLIADVMWFNLEIAQTFNKEKALKQEAFYKSMVKSFDEAVKFTMVHGLLDQFKPRLIAVYKEAQAQEWPHLSTMERSLDLID